MSQDKTPTNVYDLVCTLWKKQFGAYEADELDKLSLIEMLQDLLENPSNKINLRLT